MPGAFVILQKRSCLHAAAALEATHPEKQTDLETWYEPLRRGHRAAATLDEQAPPAIQAPPSLGAECPPEGPLNLTKPRPSEEDSRDSSVFQTPPATPPRGGGRTPATPQGGRGEEEGEELPLDLHRAAARHPEHHGCPECGKRYSTSSNLARHRQTHRSPADRKARHCPHCGKLYVSMPAFAMHVRTHSQGCQCPHCGKRFSRPWLLQGHIRTHTGERPFKCPVCAKAFADKSNLRAHIQTHSTTKPFVCGRCGKAFALKSYLYKHEESSCMRVQRQDAAAAAAAAGATP